MENDHTVSRMLNSKNKKRCNVIVASLFVIRLGLEPKTPTLKVLCSTN